MYFKRKRIKWSFIYLKKKTNKHQAFICFLFLTVVLVVWKRIECRICIWQMRVYQMVLYSVHLYTRTCTFTLVEIWFTHNPLLLFVVCSSQKLKAPLSQVSCSLVALSGSKSSHIKSAFNWFCKYNYWKHILKLFFFVEILYSIIDLWILLNFFASLCRWLKFTGIEYCL